MNRPAWKVEMQPARLIASIQKSITDLPGGYAEAVAWLGVTENALSNWFRTDRDQLFPIGWAMMQQQAGEQKLIADAVAKASGCVNVPLVEVEDIESADINDRLLESIEWLGKHAALMRKGISHGVIDDPERDIIEKHRFQVMTKWQEYLTFLYRVFCKPVKMSTQGCSPRVLGAKHSECGE